MFELSKDMMSSLLKLIAIAEYEKSPYLFSGQGTANTISSDLSIRAVSDTTFLPSSIRILIFLPRSILPVLPSTVQ